MDSKDVLKLRTLITGPTVSLGTLSTVLDTFVTTYGTNNDDYRVFERLMQSVVTVLRNRRRVTIDDLRSLSNEAKVAAERRYSDTDVESLVLDIVSFIEREFMISARQPRIEQAPADGSQGDHRLARKVIDIPLTKARSGNSRRDDNATHKDHEGSALTKDVSAGVHAGFGLNEGMATRLPYVLTQYDLENSSYDDRDLQSYLGVSSSSIRPEHGEVLLEAGRNGGNPLDAGRITLQAARILWDFGSYQDEVFVTSVGYYAQFTGRKFQREAPRKDATAFEYFLEAVQAFGSHPLILRDRLRVTRRASLASILTSLICIHDPTFAATRHDPFVRPLRYVFQEAEGVLKRIHGDKEGTRRADALVRDVVIGLLRVRKINTSLFQDMISGPINLVADIKQRTVELAPQWFAGFRPTPGKNLATLFSELQQKLGEADSQVYTVLGGYLNTTPNEAGHAAASLFSALGTLSLKHLLDLDRHLLGSLKQFLSSVSGYYSAELFSSRSAAQDQARSMLERLRTDIKSNPTRLGVAFVLPVLEHAWNLVASDFLSRKASASPRLRVTLLKDQLPLTLGEYETRTIEVQVQVTNEGEDSASEVSAIVSVDPKTPGNITGPADVALRTLEGHRSKVFTVSVQVGSNLTSLILVVDIAYRYDSRNNILPTCHLEISHSRPVDLTPLVDGSTPPYSLDAIEDPQRLRGRREVMDQLQAWLKTATRVPIVLHGQRRVGKSSVGSVFAGNVSATRPEYVVCSFEWLLYANSPLWSILRGILADHVVPAVQKSLGKKAPPIPSRDDMREDPLGCFAGYLREALRNKKGLKILFVIDEFDSVAITYSQKHIDAGFFVWLRGLMNIDGIRFVFIGGEGLPNILNDFGEEFNRSSPLLINHLDPGAAIELVQEPVRSHLRFTVASLDRIFEYCDGNPYYSTWLSIEILKVMAAKQEGTVSIVDVEQAVSSLLRSFDESKFVHLWQKDEAHYLVLRGVAEASFSQAQGRPLFFREFTLISAIRQTSPVKGLDETILASALDMLETRRVLQRKRVHNGWAYRIRIGLFADWLHRRASLELRGIRDINLSIWEGDAAQDETQVLMGEDHQV